MSRIALAALTNRDLSMLAMVYAYDGCTTDHLWARFFVSLGARSSCYRRVAWLSSSGFLQATRLPSCTGIGSGKQFLSIGPTGRAVLAEFLAIPLAELRRNTRTRVPRLLDHHLAICRTRLAIELASLRSRVFRLESWLTDFDMHRSPIRVDDPSLGRPVPVIPDGALVLSMGTAGEQVFYLEQDLDSVSPKRMRIKLRLYYLARGQQAPVLFVTRNKNRQTAILQWAEEAARAEHRDPTIIWTTTESQLSPQSVLKGTIWAIAGGPNGVALEDLALGRYVKQQAEIGGRGEDRRGQGGGVA